ncbi:MAG: hypothetical protein OEU93_18050, partial [Rubrivivax sp.]|nr:hypothetical protein [Rubrivivax sp.]
MTHLLQGLPDSMADLQGLPIDGGVGEQRPRHGLRGLSFEPAVRRDGAGCHCVSHGSCLPMGFDEASIVGQVYG